MFDSKIVEYRVVYRNRVTPSAVGTPLCCVVSRSMISRIELVELVD